MRILKILIPFILILSALFMSQRAWVIYNESPWTRDAKIHAEIINLSPEVSGKIVKIHVTDNQHIKKGTLIFEIDQQDYKLMVEQKLFAKEKAKADYEQALDNHQRDQALLKNNLISAEEVSNERYQEQMSKSAYFQAESEYKKAKLDLTRTKIYAPKSGYISNLTEREGNYINEGEIFSALIEQDSFYILAYFLESKLQHIKIGSNVTITPFFSDDTLQGKIEGFNRAVVDQSADNSGTISNVNSTVPWVRLGQRIPVRISISDKDLQKYQLVAGTTVSVSLN